MESSVERESPTRPGFVRHISNVELNEPMNGADDPASGEFTGNGLAGMWHRTAIEVRRLRRVQERWKRERIELVEEWTRQDKEWSDNYALLCERLREMERMLEMERVEFIKRMCADQAEIARLKAENATLKSRLEEHTSPH